MIDKLIEEKVRGIFYGKPTDFFEKDKAKIGFTNIFSNEKYQGMLCEYGEIIARRNIIVHNSGKVDSKYLREVTNSSFKLQQKVYCNRDYIKHAVIVLRGAAALSTKLVLEKTYNSDIANSRVHRMANTFIKYLNVEEK